ncbi:MAG: sigma-70 family RNA polymerase sigma factor [Acidobacteria bacterium]|nr:sigma-70 family RNA polymerase sigma factor [Acidobacteriota bacterium]
MPDKNAQPPDNLNSESLIDLLPFIPSTVRQACHVYGHNPSQDEVADLSQSIVLLLIDDNYRRLRSFNHRSSLKTWLQTVIYHYVLHYLRRQKCTVNIEDMAPDELAHQPDQEEKFLFEERRELLDVVVSMLTERERELWDLLSGGLSDEEIAKQMMIKVRSVQRKKYALLNKIRGFIARWGGVGL